jgi:hypothetical protein
MSERPGEGIDDPQTDEERAMMTDRRDDQRTAGPRAGLGAGIIALGILSIVTPLVIDQLPSVTDGGSPAFVVSGMSVLIGIFVIIAGVMSIVVKD